MQRFKQSGGRRENSGRLPVGDKKQPVTIFIKGSEIEYLGKDLIKEVMADAVAEAVKRKQQDKFV